MLSMFFGRNVGNNTFILYSIGSYLVYNLLLIEEGKLIFLRKRYGKKEI
jgi:hypothetical protein